MDEQMFLGLSTDEWFTYHPPKTEVRKKAHEQMNANALQAARALNTEVAGSEIEEFLTYLETHVIMYASELTDWFEQLAHRFKDPRNSELDQMMLIQSARMLGNQIITVADLKGLLDKDNA